MRSTRKRKYSMAQVTEALRNTRGLVTYAAKYLGCSRNTLTAYLKQSPKLAAVLRETAEASLDRAEYQLFKGIDNGEAWAICFYLKCKGKARGYVEKLEVIPGEMPEAVNQKRALSPEEIVSATRRLIDGGQPITTKTVMMIALETRYGAGRLPSPLSEAIPVAAEEIVDEEPAASGGNGAEPHGEAKEGS